MGNLLNQTIAAIRPSDAAAREAAKERWDRIAKPLHGLGDFEDILSAIAGMQGSASIDIRKKALLVFCADNGVVAEGVTQTGQEVTAQVAENMLAGDATAAIFCRSVGAELVAIDIGMARETALGTQYRIASGTNSFSEGPAMTPAQALQAVETGISIARKKVEEGCRLLATGEMGIGNTTTSSAVAAVLLSRPVEEVTGRGAGLDTEGLARKIRVIKQAIRDLAPDADDPMDVLAKVGGFDIAGMTGAFLGGAACRVPVVIDGFISAVAALLASRLCPAASDYMIASHLSGEPAAAHILEVLQKHAVLQAGMHLGEGSGAVMLFPLLDMALSIYTDMPTFADTNIDAYVPLH